MASEVILPLIVNDVAGTAAADITWLGGRGTFMVESSVWGGGSVTLQYQSPHGTFINVDSTNAVFTANGMIDVELPPGVVKAVRATATGVYAYLIGTRVE